MAFHVRDPRTDLAVRKLAALTGKSLTATIREAVENEYRQECEPRKRDISVADAEEAINDFIKNSGAEITPITPEIGQGAIRAFERFGRSRHPARLNMGDCFAYACARALDVPLLYKGDDFAQTDV